MAMGLSGDYSKYVTLYTYIAEETKHFTKSTAAKDPRVMSRPKVWSRKLPYKSSTLSYVHSGSSSQQHAVNSNRCKASPQ
eukprot:4665336-Amphidinium_carterae.1